MMCLIRGCWCLWGPLGLLLELEELLDELLLSLEGVLCFCWVCTCLWELLVLLLELEELFDELLIFELQEAEVVLLLGS